MRRETKIAAAVFVPLPVSILLISAIATWALAQGAPEWVRMPFRLLCHGLPQRSLTLFGTTMPICARCTAIYIGLFAGLVAFLVMPWMRERVLRLVMYVAAVPIAVDGITQALRLRESTNGLRIGTGLAIGLAFGMWILSAVERRERQVFTSP